MAISCSGDTLPYFQAIDSAYDEVSFEDIRAVCELEQSIRVLLLEYLLKLEVFFKASFAVAFADRHCLTPPNLQHYESADYFKGSAALEIINRVQEKAKTHYPDLWLEYGDFKYPLDILLAMMSFSDLPKVYSCLYKKSSGDRVSENVSLRIAQIKSPSHNFLFTGDFPVNYTTLTARSYIIGARIQV